LIGRVIKVESVSTGMFQDIAVQALVDFDRLEEVFIVKQNQPIPMNIQNESDD
jgi:cell shape-determining protein MreC